MSACDCIHCERANVMNRAADLISQMRHAARESCRAWVDDSVRCSQQAEFILWGKLFDKDALGPMCWEHTAKWLPDMSSHTIEQYAVFDLRPFNPYSYKIGE